MTGPRVVGIDLSLASTGLADNQGRVARVQTKTTGGGLEGDLRRQNTIINRVVEFCGMWHPDLVVLEGPAFSRGAMGGQHSRAGLWWRLVAALTPLIPGEGWPYTILVVPPTTRAMYATGRGSAGKDEVLAAAIRRYPAWDITGNDIGDAVVLAALGARLLGHPIDEPMPQAHLRALAKLDLPGGAS